MSLWLTALLSAAAFAAPQVERSAPEPIVGALAAPAAIPQISLPPSIVAADAAQAPWLAEVVAHAQANSPTARRVLRDVAALSARTGRTAVVALGRTDLGGELDVNDGVITLGQKHMKEPPGSGATTLMHELRHWVQLESGLPMDGLEMELDAYLVDFRVAAELGDQVPPRSYDGRARKAFTRGLDPFVRFLSKNYSDNIVIRGSSLKAYERAVAEPIPDETKRAERLSRKVAAGQETLAAMGRAGRSAREIDYYRQRAVQPAQNRLNFVERTLAARKRDLAWLADPANRRRFRSFLNRLYARARALGAAYKLP